MSPPRSATASRTLLSYKAPCVLQDITATRGSLPTRTSEQLHVSQQSSYHTASANTVATGEQWVSAAAEQEEESLPRLAQRDIVVTAPHTLLWVVHYSAADTAAATASPLVTAAARSVLSRASSSRMHWTLSRSTASCSLCSEKRRSSSEASFCRMATVSA